MEDTSVVPAKRRKMLNARGALAWLAEVAEGHPEGTIEADSIAHLGTLLGWDRPRTSKQLKAWQTSGQITVDRAGTGKLVIRILPGRHGLERAGTPSRSTRAKRAGGTPAERAIGTRAERASERAADRVKVANIDNGSDAYTDRVSSVGTLGTREISSKDARTNASSGTPAARVPGTPSSPLSRHADREGIHRAENIAWHAGGAAAGDDGSAAARPRLSGLDVLAVIAALSLAGVATWMSIRGMIVLFPDDRIMAFLLAVALEGAKLLTAGWLGHQWSKIRRSHRIR